MESSDDTCAVAAAIVGLTERVLPDTDAVAAALKAEGLPRERIGAIVRALRPYAALLDPNAAARVHTGGVVSGKPGWWRRLFG
ncbi:hypothetical protein LRS03_15750 [Rhizobacter sp. J219]|uniref:hypothetical protein n=1 Tax=Rhizobacter sp. J219 TaxID=2898430 RepID=UPI0021507BAA|nr:hypothetical protein [Rhizobacter sp. J219]MCR5884227.1 hypothetical protein [Rhizobacter sp. J219]